MGTVGCFGSTVVAPKIEDVDGVIEAFVGSETPSAPNLGNSFLGSSEAA